MQIIHNLPEVFERGSSSARNARALKIELDCLIAHDLDYLQHHACPKLKNAGVIYGRTVWWENIPAVLERGYGDCKSLSAWRTAELRHAGLAAKPVFRWVKNPDGYRDFHILVQTEGGFEDPSKELGMGRDENVYF